jgi:hypothetical protein
MTVGVRGDALFGGGVGIATDVRAALGRIGATRLTAANSRQQGDGDNHRRHDLGTCQRWKRKKGCDDKDSG